MTLNSDVWHFCCWRFIKDEIVAKIITKLYGSMWCTTKLRTGYLHQSYRCWGRNYYNDVIMGAIASQITSLTIVYSTVYSDADQRIHQSSASLAICAGNSSGTGEFPAPCGKFTSPRWMTNGQSVCGKCFHLTTSPCSPAKLGQYRGYWWPGYESLSFGGMILLPVHLSVKERSTLLLYDNCLWMFLKIFTLSPNNTLACRILFY